MFEGIYFQFPKLGFILFFFLACEALCPLRSNPLYFPRPSLFGEVGVKPPIWLWIAKWAMIAFLIVTLMSPVRDREIVRHERGWDILIIVDPSLVEPKILPQITSFIDNRQEERIALWVPPMTVVPLTYDHQSLVSVLEQTPKQAASISVNQGLGSFFATSPEGKKLAVILTDNPKSFVASLPERIQSAVISPMKEPQWGNTLNRTYPPYKIQETHRYFDYYYVYPLFLAFLAMLAYLYGRNQKGIR
jgi:Ca-activated chloride channel family protein